MPSSTESPTVVAQRKLCWLANNPSKITAPRLSKALPDSLRDGLREGGAGCEAAATTVGLLLDARSTKTSEQESHACYLRIANLAAPGNHPFLTPLKHKISFEFCSLLTIRRPPPKPLYEEEWMEVVSRYKSDLDVVIQNNREGITAGCFRNSKEAFSKHCEEINGMSFLAFREAAGNDYICKKGSSIQISRRVNAVALQMNLQLDQESSHICWDCTSDKCDFTCSGCKLAVYCSETCQQKHWKHLHKAVCNRIKDAFEVLGDLETTIYDAMADVKQHSVKYGTKPSRMDFDIPFKTLRHMFFLDLLSKPKAGFGNYGNTPQETKHSAIVDKGLKGPSMVYFYNNVKHVIRGDFGTSIMFRTWLPNHNLAIEDEDESRLIEFFAISRVMMYSYEDNGGAGLRVDWFRDMLGTAPAGALKDYGHFSECSLNDWLVTYKSSEVDHNMEAEVVPYYRELMLNRVTLWLREEIPRIVHLKPANKRMQVPHESHAP